MPETRPIPRSALNVLPLKERMKIIRRHMPELDPQMRSRNFEEVNLGLPAADALTEATRCIACAKPGCVVDCPVGVKIKEVVALIYAGDYLAAAAKLREDNALPAITGRVCPQENQCEGGCVLGKKGAPVAIGNLERFVADFERASGQLGLPANAPAHGQERGHRRQRPGRALSAAGDLDPEGPSRARLRGPARAGRRARLRHSGVPPAQGHREGRGGQPAPHGRRIRDQRGRRQERHHRRADAATSSYDAVFVATGAGLPRLSRRSRRALQRRLLGQRVPHPRQPDARLQRPTNTIEPVYDCRDRDVIVVGGGNTAMDAVRTARRLGARTATLVYRRTEAEMPARAEEVKHAREEGIEFRMLTNPIEFLGDEKGWLTGARCVRMELGEPDDSGRRRPVAIKGSEYILPASVAIIGVGTTANPLIQSTTPDLATNKWNYIVADEQSMRTSKRGVFAGGDIVTGGATVILAMGAGRKAAASIDEYLSGGAW